MEREVYKDCMRNHAATLGAYATDGCGEYTADATSPGTSLRCAACGCHRNFHRKVAPPPPSTGYSPTSSHEEGTWGPDGGKRRARRRTKFTEGQKEEMMKFAERIRWKMPRREGGSGGGEDQVTGFCREIGVSRQVFKVWMHNHKSISSSSFSTASAAKLLLSNAPDKVDPNASGGGGGDASMAGDDDELSHSLDEHRRRSMPSAGIGQEIKLQQ